MLIEHACLNSLMDCFLEDLMHQDANCLRELIITGRSLKEVNVLDLKSASTG